MASFKLHILSPHGRAFEGDCESLSAPGREGDFGVLPGHAPMIALLRRGISKIVSGDRTTYFVTGQGVCEVSRDGVSVLVDAASLAGGPDEAKSLLAEQLQATGHRA